MARPSKPREERQLAWLDRSKSDAQPATWRPVAIYRLGGKHWTSNIDNQFLTSTPTGGLVFFRYDKLERGLWSSWRTYPYVAFSLDLGPKGLCGYNALEQLFMLNCDKWPDNSHGCNRDFFLALGLVGLKGFWLVMMICWNAEFGPDREHGRSQQLSTAMASCYHGSSAAENPLFQSKVGDVIDCLKQLGYVFDSPAPIDSQAWEHLKKTPFSAVGLSRCNLNRFMGGLYTARERLKRWDLDAWESEWLALECDMLHSKKLLKKVTFRPAAMDAVPECGSSTASMKIQFEDRQSMNFCQNAIQTRCVMLPNLDNKRIVAIVFTCSAAVLEWHGVQNRSQRSADETEAWHKSQLTGGLMDHVNKLVGSLSDPKTSVACSFISSRMAAEHTCVEEAIVEDEFADLQGQYTMGLVGCRLRRTLHMSRGWPCQFYKVVCDNGKYVAEIHARFQRDRAIYEALKAFDAKLDIHDDVLERHLFRKISNVQLMKAIDETNGAGDPDLLEICRARIRVLSQTQVAEDVIGTEKNTIITTAQKKFKKPESAMAAVLRAKTLSHKHRYMEVDVTLPLGSKTASLSGSDFQATKSKRTLDFELIASAKQKAEWYSPGASDHMVPAADLQMLSDAFNHDESFSCMQYAWLGELVSVEHRFLMELPATGGKPSQWVLGLDHYKDSSVQCWPVTLEKVKGYNDEFIKLGEKVSEPLLISVFDVERTRAVSFKWRSWFGQYMAYTTTEARKQLVVPITRAFVSGQPDSLLRLAARHAFWQFRMPFLVRLSGELRLDMGAYSGLCGLLVNLIKSVLEITEAEAIEIVSLRLAINDVSAAFATQLLQLDEAIDCMDTNDAKKVHQEQETANDENVHRSTFVREYHIHRRRINDAAMAKSNPGPKAKAKSQPRVTLVFDGAITQVAAKEFIPPGASIWKNRRKGTGGWCGHMAPRARISEPYDGNEGKSLRLILHRLWQQYLEIKAFEWRDCPYVFDDASG
jgi:hypothetical protein